MGLLRSKESKWWYGVTESASGAWGAIEGGTVCEGTGAIDPVLRDFEARGLVEALPDPAEPGALARWLPFLGARVRTVTPRDFVAPPEPRPDVYLTEREVLGRFGWTPEALAHAQTALAFPRAALRKEKFVEDHRGARWEYSHYRWGLKDVEQWERETQRSRSVFAGLSA